ncbi:hypothetical protein K493DRAFT_409283 [Basidiobolus meristosporus CBS 931.73]|uniref:Large ribosomal subunit protein mL54 n=1 Tax=Basidiobolus meristosporus CBS 931.73 TaxID=1314790 RepID=A0A1Y1Y0N2_9FUNG|nr:hypothetical protein K493DRAFT_409283 [Basidiobolus meristosporus CBS 931.73]|eukprot:ORX91550.1 hypothetical protein K493DRAFT_409283 [Basidiobolus meristosporus CBS 931.73]
MSGLLLRNVALVRLFRTTAVSASNVAAKAEGKTKKVYPTSSAPEGTVLKGINFTKGKGDPIAKAESEYPEWLWELLDTEKREARRNDPNDKAYYRRVNKEQIKATNFMKNKKT